MWWVMAESCLPCSLSACSIRYHFVPLPPFLLCHLQQAVLHRPRSAQCSLLTGLWLPGKPSPTETSHDSTGWGRRDGKRGRRCSFGPVRSPGCTGPLALPQHTAPSATHRNTETHTYMHQNTWARERNGQRVKEREDSQLSDSELSSESVCVWLIEVIYAQSPVTPCMVHDFIKL